MKLFGYYALHSFVNQIRKLLKTWVLIFILVCGLMGGLIGYGAATLEDVADSRVEAGETVQEEEDSWELPISGNALLELIAGGAVLAFFLFEAGSADTHGSKIFLPADVNLLFASPMKPQSVLMFRLATQLGTALAATIYMLFQVPNLMLNLGLSGWAVTGLLAVWFAAILMGKLLQVLLYTICSTTPVFKKYLRRGVYVFTAVIGAAFLMYYRISGLELLPALDGFFNAPGTRWIPVWGWMKGIVGFAAERNDPMALLCFFLVCAASAGMVWGIGQVHADFYEDAMAKSEETAALLEKARSEKSSGVAATRQRTKDRKDSLRRDGLNHGWGANVFFFKSLYNRFRFSHFGLLTKTTETYLASAIGVCLIQKFFFDTASALPVVLTLGALVFFRAMGNPLEEDTEMDFFRLIPESTWKKLFYSLMGGIVNCILDLLLPMLAASAMLMVNPLELLMWLPVIVTVDFYATCVGAFISLSVPVSAGKMVKQFVQILFIYFGLLPDIAILAVGIVLENVLPAALISTLINLGLGFLFFSLASIFLEPKGRDYIQANEAQDLSQARKQFSTLGMAIFAMLAVTSVVQIGLSAAAVRWFPGLLEGSWSIWALTFLPEYVLGVPAALLLLFQVPGSRPAQQKLGFGTGIKFFFICIFMMYGGNLLGNLITTLLGMLKQASVVNPLETYVSEGNLIAQILIIAVLAPILEEFIFRKLLIDRMHPYGGKLAVLMSALLFGLFHGNLSQFFYAFGLGLAFGYIYLSTGRLRYSIIAHICINFMGSIFIVQVINHLPIEALDAMDIDALTSGSNLFWLIGYFGYLILLIVGSLTGLTLLCMNARKLRFPAAPLELPKGSRMRVACVNAGMILMLLGSLALIAMSILV